MYLHSIRPAVCNSRPTRDGSPGTSHLLQRDAATAQSSGNLWPIVSFANMSMSMSMPNSICYQYVHVDVYANVYMLPICPCLYQFLYATNMSSMSMPMSIHYQYINVDVYTNFYTTNMSMSMLTSIRCQPVHDDVYANVCTLPVFHSGLYTCERSIDFT